MKQILYPIVLMSLIFLAAPYIIVKILQPEALSVTDESLTLVRRAQEQTLPDLVYNNLEIIDLDDFERYLIGVVAAEMPALFHIEALKAQAVASRTYAIYTMQTLNMEVFDPARMSEIWQAYISEDEMRRRWGGDFDRHFATIFYAVSSTAGEILVYDGAAIVAVFHAFSGGRTEASENVWSEPRPYLRSVPSDFYSHRADFEQTLEFSGNEFIGLLRAEFSDITFDEGDIGSQITINTRTEAGYVTQATIGNKVIDGAALRRILGLRSTNFTVSRELDKIVFRVKGYGHGAGMSQVGANELALRGHSYGEILKHYYSGVELWVLP